MKKKKPSLRRQLENWSKKVRERDGNKCVLCNSTDHIQAHHIFQKKLFKDYRFELNNGISLCNKHHAFGRYSVHRGIGDFLLFEYLRESRPEQYKFIKKTLKELHEKEKELYR